MKVLMTVLAGALVLGPVGTSRAAEVQSFEKDRKAILAMVGKFDVEFTFKETVPLVSGYELKAPYRADALEIVKVVEDHQDLIVLQHILLAEVGPVMQVVKHWGQVWKYEDPVVVEYQGERTWKKRTLPASQVKGTWTQLVTQVDDSPRYESWGTWSHEGNRSAWTSKDTCRPLPRREYTKRSDYDILRAVNRHVITPEGWVHEQENRKWIKGENKFLCHETGLNIYRRYDQEDFSKAENYWEATKDFWQEVRTEWRKVIRDHDVISYKKEFEGSSLIRSTFSMASKVQKGESLKQDAVKNLVKGFTE
jgi:hypothetical protein